MNLVCLKQKLEKGITLGANEIYIKDNNIIKGIESIYKDIDKNEITLLVSEDETINVDNFMSIIDEICDSMGDSNILIGDKKRSKDSIKQIVSVEFAQYENYKMLFINI